MHMRTDFHILAFWVFFLTFASTAFAAPASDPVAEAVQKRYAAITTMKSSFTQTLVHKESGGKEQRSGVLFFAKPMQVRWETQNPAPELLLVTSTAIWNVFPDENVAYKYAPTLGDDAKSIMQIITGQSPLHKDFFIENKGRENNRAKLVLIPKEPNQSLVEATIWVEEATGLIKQVIIVDFYYNQNEIHFGAQEIDAQLPSSTFIYNPPNTMKIEDRSASGVLQKPLMQ